MNLLNRIPDACDALGVSRATLYRLIDAGEIEVVHIGSRTLVPTDALEAFVQRLRERAADGAAPPQTGSNGRDPRAGRDESTPRRRRHLRRAL